MNFYIYRLPGEKIIKGAKSDSFLCGVSAIRSVNGKDVFMIAPFIDKDDDFILIPHQYSFNIEDLDVININYLNLSQATAGRFVFPLSGTTKDEHKLMVEAAISTIKSSKIDKCVLARTIIHTGNVSLRRTFDNLCNAYENAFVFCFYTPYTGLWMGATPELLLKKDNEGLHTMALAGTMGISDDSEWDNKNIKEHTIVAEYIVQQFKEYGLFPQISGMGTVAAGPVKHLRTLISASKDREPEKNYINLARKLSPTPALSGYPPDMAIQTIKRIEPFERGYYGGFIGPIQSNGDFSLFVNLRSLQIGDGKFCQYAGGGIMETSEPETEWIETERKAEAIKKYVSTLDKS